MVKIVLVMLMAFCLLACQPTAPESNETANTASREKISLKLAHSWAKGLPFLATSVDDFANLVEEMSNGDIQIRVDSANKHKSAFGVFDYVKSGQYDIGQSASYYYGGKDPDTLFFSSMPFDMTYQEQISWFYHGGGLELANEVYAKHNIEVMPAGNTGMQMGGWFRKEINTIDDLKGLKIRMPGFAGKVIAEVGAVPTNISSGELYQSLERGTIDALEWLGPALDMRMGFHKVADYYYTGWHEPGTELMYFFNKTKMDSLPEWAQSILRNAAKLAASNMSNAIFDANAVNWQNMEAAYPNVKIRNFPAEVINALKETNAKLVNKEAQRSEIAKRIIDSRADYLAKARKWTNIGEQAYLNALND